MTTQGNTVATMTAMIGSLAFDIQRLLCVSDYVAKLNRTSILEGVRMSVSRSSRWWSYCQARAHPLPPLTVRAFGVFDVTHNFAEGLAAQLSHL